METNEKSEPKNDTSHLQPYKHSIIATALLASLIDYIVAGTFIMLADGSADGIANGSFLGA